MTTKDGHYAPETGRTMESMFVSLIERVGFRVLRRGVGAGGLDVIAEFAGSPIRVPDGITVKLLQPCFSPKGVVAFSLKKRDLEEPDITELNDKVAGINAGNKPEIIIKISGQIIVTNFTKTESYIEELSAKNIYCWDGRRLLFYSAKAKVIKEFFAKGDVEEYFIEKVENSSYLKQIETHENNHVANIAIFVDNHQKKMKVSADHIQVMLLQIYKECLEPIVRYATSLVKVKVQLNSLGLIDEELVKQAYEEFASKLNQHPKVLFEEFCIFEYDSAPWAILFI